MEPIGPFNKIKSTDWRKNVEINFLNQMHLLHGMLKSSSLKENRVLFFAGGGTNSSPENYSCYTVSKIALIKMVELLDNEIDNITFTILGPGWVKTKIHKQSMNPSLKGYSSYVETNRRIRENDFVEMDKVVESVEWILNQDKEIIGGRNFSAVHDPWGSRKLEELLLNDPSAFKLRRHSNSTLHTDR